MVDNNTTEKLDVKRKEVHEKSKIVDFDKNIQNIKDNRQYRKKKNKLYSDIVKSVVSSTDEATESENTVADLKNIQSILLRDENLNSSKIQNSPPDICTYSSTTGNVSSNVSLNVES